MFFINLKNYPQDNNVNAKKARSTSRTKGQNRFFKNRLYQTVCNTNF